MPLQKDIITSQITVDEFDNILVRTSTRVSENGVLLGERFHRVVIEPGDPLTGLDGKVIAIAQIVHTPAAIAAAIARREAGRNVA